jgi:hypothetical protein
VLVKQILSYPGLTKNTKVSMVMIGTRISNITSKIIETALCDGVKTYGKAKLWIYKHKVGTHSIRSGSAMAMYIGGVPVFAIMMIGRWLPDAFMKYICKQIKEFTFDVSQRMLTMQHFRHTPTNATNDSKKEYSGCADLMLGNWKWSRHQVLPTGIGRGETIL